MTMTNEQWLAERRTGIGGSDVASILGMSNWKTPYEIWADKLGIVEPKEPTKRMILGTYLEPVIRQLYCDQTGFSVVKPEKSIASEKYPFMRANLDGIVVDDGRIFEAKLAYSRAGWGEVGTDQVPDNYLVQVQHYLAVTGKPLADVAVFHPGNDEVDIYTVPEDKELQEELIEREHEFWQQVLKKEPPEPKSYADVRIVRQVKGFTEDSIQATDDILASCKELQSISDQMAALEAREAEIKATVAQFMGDHKSLFLNDKKLAYWCKGSTRKTLDNKKIKEQFPEVFNQCQKPTTTSPYIRFNKLS